MRTPRAPADAHPRSVRAAELGLREPEVLLEARRDVADCEVFGCSIDEMREIHERLVAARSTVP